MDRAAFDKEDSLKVKPKAEKQTPRADRSGGGGLLSAMGNARVQRLLRSGALQRKGGAAGGTVEDEVSRAINSKRGSGSGLDEASRKDLEPAFGQDFSDVRVHTDDEADSLNKAVQAEAFTTGRDIFFRKGSYSPGSSEGKKLLAHELTHVVQQRDVPPSQDLTVSSPEDASEVQAGDVASSLAGGASAAIGRQATEEEEEPLQRAAIERQAPVEQLEEEEEIKKSPLERVAAPEEEEVATSSLARVEGEEEEVAPEEAAASPLGEQVPEEDEAKLSTSPMAMEAEEESTLQASRRR